MMIAADVGGTKCNLALFERTGKTYEKFHTFPSKEFTTFREVVQNYIDIYKLQNIESACFAIAGPIYDDVCKATNLPWVIDARDLERTLNIPKVYLINDLEANAFAIDLLDQKNLLLLHPGKGKQEGNRAVISPGTGLGEAGLYFDGKRHHPFACEGGHCEIGPRDDLQIDLVRYIHERFGHASYERVLSGPGLVNVYEFFRDVQKLEEPSSLREEMTQEIPAKVITEHGLKGRSELCVKSLDLFVSMLGSEASNCALKFMALGGVYLGGGIPPKILPKLQDPLFYKGFTDKGRFRELLETISIRVILDEKASLRGAGFFAASQASGALL